MVTNGIYCVEFGGQGGTGVAMLLCLAGTITGADNYGSRIDGSYGPGEAGGTVAQLTVQLPAGRRSALTGRNESGPLIEEWSVTLPGDGMQIKALLWTSRGYPLEVHIKRLRSLPVEAVAPV